MLPSRRCAWTDLGRIAAMRHHFLQPWHQSIDGFHGKDSLVKPPTSRTSKEWVCTPRTPSLTPLSLPPLTLSLPACMQHARRTASSAKAAPARAVPIPPRPTPPRRHAPHPRHGPTLPDEGPWPDCSGPGLQRTGPDRVQLAEPSPAAADPLARVTAPGPARRRARRGGGRVAH